jgi:PII-like signaling protein
MLGFMDGTVVLYRIYVFTIRFRTQPVKMSVIKRLHEPGMRGAKAAEFILGYTRRVISVGLDGQCRLVDLGRVAKVNRTW